MSSKHQKNQFCTEPPKHTKTKLMREFALTFTLQIHIDPEDNPWKLLLQHLSAVYVDLKGLSHFDSISLVVWNMNGLDYFP